MMTPEEKRMAIIRRKRQIRRRKKIKRIRLGLFSLFSLLTISIALFLGRGSFKNNASVLHTNASVKTGAHTADGAAGTSIRSGYLDTLDAMAEQDSQINTVLKNESDYPDEILKILVNNPETIDFVLNYPEKKDSRASDSIGNVVRGEVPLLLQWDERWGYGEYGGSIIAVSGCGPTCIAMVASGLTGLSDITPAAVAKYSTENGFLTEQYDTKWDLMSYGCEQYGIVGTELVLDESIMKNTLESGSPIICSVGPGDFTSNGHFIVLTGVQDGKFKVNDPNSKVRSEQLWSFDTLKGQISNLWGYQLCDWYKS